MFGIGVAIRAAAKKIGGSAGKSSNWAARRAEALGRAAAAGRLAGAKAKIGQFTRYLITRRHDPVIRALFGYQRTDGVKGWLNGGLGKRIGDQFRIGLAVVALPLVWRRIRLFDTYLKLSPEDLVVRVAGRERDRLPWDSIAGFRVEQRRRDPAGSPRGAAVSRAGTPPWLVMAELRDATVVELWPTACKATELRKVRLGANEEARRQAEALAQRLEHLRRQYSTSG